MSFTQTDMFAATHLPPPSGLPTPAEARQQARCRASNVLSEFKLLRDILDRHEETLRKRWAKKTRTKRKEVLIKIWPTMAPSHRPDYEAFQKSQLSRAAYLMPYMNIEDLSQGNTLLLLLNARGRNQPSNFTHADFEACRLGHVSGAVMPTFLNNFTMFLDGEDIETYGRMVAWDDDDSAFGLMMSQRAFQPGEALMILEIQEKVLHFLVQWSQRMLHDIAAADLVDAYPVKPALDPPKSTEEWSSIATLAKEAPYRLPAQLDINRLKAIFAAKLAASVDHVWALREDPGYFQDTVRDWSEHRQETMPDINGSRHPILDTPLFWDRVIGNVIADAYGAIFVYDILHKQLEMLASLQEKYAHEISPQKKLPEEYMVALLTFRYYLDQSAEGPIINLKQGVPASIRTLFKRLPQDPNTTKLQITTGSANSDPLLWLFFQIWDDRQRFLCGLPLLVDELERLVLNEPRQKDRLTSWVLNVLGDLGNFARARHELDIYFPWAATMNDEEVYHGPKIKREFADRFAGLGELDRSLKDIKLSKLGAPSSAKFHYPNDKRRSKENTETLRMAEQNLDNFWEDVDYQYRSKTGRALQEAVREMIGDRELERTPKWVEEPKVRKQKGHSAQELHTPLSSLVLEDRAQSSRDFPSPKTKIKTRGESTETVTDAYQEPIPDAQPVFQVTNRALKVFRSLFFVPSETDQPGEVTWSDFLYSMSVMGFAPQKLYGSVWQFSPTELDVNRSIQFHEPHPGTKIPFKRARRIGRRLGRAYGWHGGMFVLE